MDALRRVSTGGKLSLVLAVGTVIGLGAVAPGVASAARTINAKFAHLQAPGTPTNDSALKFAKLVKQLTHGQINIKVYPSGELGDSTQTEQGVEAGTVQFYASPDLSEVVPSSQATALPFLFPSQNVASKVLNSPTAYTDIWNKFPAHGMKVLGVWSVGYSDIYSTKAPVTTLSALAGQRIRVWDPGLGTPWLKLLGADGVNVPSTEVVTAMSTHTIDGADDPPSTMFSANWTSGGGSLSIVNDDFICSPVLVSLKFWKSLSTAQQGAVQKALNMTFASNLQEAAATSVSSVAGLKKAGIQIVKPSAALLATMKQKAKVLFAKQKKAWGKVVPDLQAAVKAAS